MLWEGSGLGKLLGGCLFSSLLKKPTEKTCRFTAKVEVLVERGLDSLVGGYHGSGLSAEKRAPCRVDLSWWEVQRHGSFPTGIPQKVRII